MLTRAAAGNGGRRSFSAIRYIDFNAKFIAHRRLIPAQAA